MSGLGRALERWDAFWHASAPTAALGLFRVLFAWCLWREVETTRLKSLFAIEGGFHLPYVPLIQPVSLETYELLLGLQLPLIAMLALGLWMRPACLGLIGLQGWIFFSDQLHFRNHPWFFLLLLVALLPSAADRSFSWRSLRSAWRARRGPCAADWLGPSGPLTWQRLIQVQVTMVYVVAALHKLHPLFLRGGVVGDMLARNEPLWQARLEALLGPALASGLGDRLTSPEALLAAGVATPLLELALPLALWWRRLRPAAIVVGSGFHLTIAFLTGIHTFSYALLATYLLFLDPDAVPRAVRALGARLAASPRQGEAG